MTKPVAPLNRSQTQKQEAETTREGWLWRVLVQTDIWWNVFAFRGRNGETISSHAARAALQGKKWGIWLSTALDWIQKDHGADAIAGDMERARMIEQMEKQTGILNTGDKP